MYDFPNVIVFDIDGTIIGDIQPQVILYDLHNALKAKDKKIPVIQPKVFRETLLRGIIRPYFIRFIKKIKETIPNIEFFIYTASEKQWANFLIPHIEKACGCKFSRPILTRSNCVVQENEYKKLVDVIANCVIKTLSKKYKGLKKQDLVDKLLIIDNNVVYDKNDMKHVLLCPTYHYKIPENLPLYVNQKIFDDHKETVLNVLSHFIPSLESASSYNEFQRQFYISYIQELSRISSVDLKDKFFNHLLRIIIHKNITSFNPKTITYLTEKIQAKTFHA